MKSEKYKLVFLYANPFREYSVTCIFHFSFLNFHLLHSHLIDTSMGIFLLWTKNR